MSYRLDLDFKILSAYNKPLNDNIVTAGGTVEPAEITPRDILRQIAWLANVGFHRKTSEVRAALNLYESLLELLNDETPQATKEQASLLLRLINEDQLRYAAVKSQLYRIFPESFFVDVEIQEQALLNKTNGTKAEGVSVDPLNHDESEQE